MKYWHQNFYIIQSITDFNGVEKTEHPYEFLQGFVCYIPMIVIDRSMIVYYPDMISARLFTSLVQEHTCDQASKIHTIRTMNSIYTLREYHNPEAWKRAKAPLYMVPHIHRRYKEGNPVPEGYLLAQGRYRTKLFPPDLPDWYIHGYMYKHYGFLSAKGVKYMVYKPCFSTNHLYRDDTLFISYDKEIVPVTDDTGFAWYNGHDHNLSGPLIFDFINAAETHSNYNVAPIREALEKKKDWYYERKKEEVRDGLLYEFQN